MTRGEFSRPGPQEAVLPQVEELATVVVCDDDDPTRELLCDHLTADRYRALPAPSASDALRLCGYNQPDLMVLDLGLPDAPGIDVLRQIRAANGASDRFDPALPVIVLSGRTSDADRLRGFHAGADDYLVEPFHYPELLARLSAVLRRRNGRRGGLVRVGHPAIRLGCLRRGYAPPRHPSDLSQVGVNAGVGSRPALRVNVEEVLDASPLSLTGSSPDRPRPKPAYPLALGAVGRLGSAGTKAADGNTQKCAHHIVVLMHSPAD